MEQPQRRAKAKMTSARDAAARSSQNDSPSSQEHLGASNARKSTAFAPIATNQSDSKGSRLYLKQVAV